MMPGANCCIVGCGSSRRLGGIGIFKVPKVINENYKKWREDWLNVVMKSRVVDQLFKKQIENDTVYTCEKHFKSEYIDIFPSEKGPAKKRLIFGALPELNLPKKSCEVQSTDKRKPPAERLLTTAKKIASNDYYYESYQQLCDRLVKLKTLAH
ncbi:uncharacterized protein LOC130644899 [Hydractinia symbiolongicarpus]|uniref:uncharacterized protein LOC130641860 n=1 Tax=Hydractinia symbiolongicarpus TaxID=13093 RepID=UPI00255143AC|nr:uncharacterized protein LOC130641860 [Hydractinia symbiolongicarpus]XP_057306666.1 uncharacterized protein LOC130644899 [Hydractinia symbiolongicarpus]